MESVKKGYKKTEVGVIPEDWSCERIEQFAKITTGDKDTQDRVDDGMYPFYVRSSVVERINSYSFDGEAVLTSGDGVGVGKIYHYLNGKFDYHQRVYNVYNYRKNVSGKYFFFYFSNHFYDRVMSMTAKSSVDSVRREMIADMLVPLPPTLTEQKAIADALSDVDELIASLEKLIAKKKAIKQGAMQALLTPPHKGGKRLDGFSGEWKEVELGQILNFGSGKDYKGQKNGDIPVYGTGGIMTYVGGYLYDGESVGIGRKGTIDKPVFLSGKFWTVDTLFYAYNFQNSLPKFMYYKFLLIPWKEYNEASGVPSLSKNTLEKIRIEIPKMMEEQEAIASTLWDIDIEIESLKNRKFKLERLKQGMMQELLTGKTRLV